MTLEELIDWQRYFAEEGGWPWQWETRNAAIQTWAILASQSTKPLAYEKVARMFEVPAPVDESQAEEEFIYEWTWEDRKNFERVLANLPKD